MQGLNQGRTTISSPRKEKKESFIEYLLDAMHFIIM